MSIQKMSVNEFIKTLRDQIVKIGEEYSWNIDNNTYRGYAFQRWVANLILTLEPGFDTSPDEAMLYSNDLGADLFFEDTARSHILIVQCKYEKIGKAVDEGEVNDFFNRHEKLANHDWVMRHGSSSATEAFSDYGEKIANGFSATYYFFSTAEASQRTHDMANDCSKSYEKRNISVKCELYDFSKLKDYYIRSQSIELSGPKEVTIMLPEKRFFEKNLPYPTVVAVVKGNSLRNLYQQHRESLYAWNIRGYLGNRGINQEIRETAEISPSHFFYFNNGVSAICTEYWINGNELKAKDFQIINGAQTISSLMKAKANSDIDVLFRLTKTLSVKTDKGINRNIIKYNNSQNVVRISDFRSNDEIQLWLERQFNGWKASPVLGKIHYQRKRAIGQKKFGDSVKLEDFAKIRFAFLYEPTLVFSSPKQFWSSKEDGGAYEKAFGVQNEMANTWSDSTFEECLLSIAVFNKINKEIQDKIKKSDLRFLWRLKYHALSMFGLYYRENQKLFDVHNLLRNKPDFDTFYYKLSKIAFSVLVDVYSIGEEQKQSLFAFVRSDERWEQMKKRFTRQLSIAS